MRIPLPKLNWYSQMELPSFTEAFDQINDGYDSELYKSYVIRDLAKDLIDMRSAYEQLNIAHERLKNAYENRLLERRR